MSKEGSEGGCFEMFMGVEGRFVSWGNESKGVKEVWGVILWVVKVRLVWLYKIILDFNEWNGESLKGYCYILLYYEFYV